MDQRLRGKIADQLAEAAHDVFEVAGELEDTIDGAEWVELTALLYLCLSDLVSTGGTGVELTLPQAKKLADAHVKTMQAWSPLEKYIKERDPKRTDDEIRWAIDIMEFGKAEGELWNICPTTGRVKCLLPSWAWPDHPDNERRGRGSR